MYLPSVNKSKIVNHSQVIYTFLKITILKSFQSYVSKQTCKIYDVVR